MYSIKYTPQRSHIPGKSNIEKVKRHKRGLGMLK